MVGKELSLKIAEKCKKRTGFLFQKDEYIEIRIIRMGDDPGDTAYIRGIERFAESVGVNVSVRQLDAKEDTGTVRNEVIDASNDDDVDGILVLKPLPNHIDSKYIDYLIPNHKDVDAVNHYNQSRTMMGDFSSFVPNTALAIMLLLEHYNIELRGKHVTIINRSSVIGKPLSIMLLSQDATVTIAHSKTLELSSITKASDIVITGMGVPKALDREYFTTDSVVIDVGMSEDSKGNIHGDVDYEDVKSYVRLITPVFGGVGPVTTAVMIERLINNVMMGWQMVRFIKW